MVRIGKWGFLVGRKRLFCSRIWNLLFCIGYWSMHILKAVSLFIYLSILSNYCEYLYYIWRLHLFPTMEQRLKVYKLNTSNHLINFTLFSTILIQIVIDWFCCWNIPKLYYSSCQICWIALSFPININILQQELCFLQPNNALAGYNIWWHNIR